MTSGRPKVKWALSVVVNLDYAWFYSWSVKVWQCLQKPWTHFQLGNKHSKVVFLSLLKNEYWWILMIKIDLKWFICTFWGIAVRCRMPPDMGYFEPCSHIMSFCIKTKYQTTSKQTFWCYNWLFWDFDYFFQKILLHILAQKLCCLSQTDFILCLKNHCLCKYSMLRHKHLWFIDKCSLYMYIFLFFSVGVAAYIQVHPIIWKLRHKCR